MASSLFQNRFINWTPFFFYFAEDSSKAKSIRIYIRLLKRQLWNVNTMDYDYKRIKDINNEGIRFTYGNRILFDECRKNWAEGKGVEYDSSNCVAERNGSDNPACFLFYSKEKCMIKYKRGLLPWSRSHKKAFMAMQKTLSQLGYSSYDVS